MASCCDPKEPEEKPSCCSESVPKKRKRDYLFWSSFLIVTISYLSYLLTQNLDENSVTHFTHGVYELMNTMFIGLLIGVFFVGLIGKIPKMFITSAIGRGHTLSGIFRATFAGVALDLCSHGILLVAMRLYERGASLGQVMAFLIASPWNSLSLTVILITLIGWQLTLLFLFASMLVGIISGLVFDKLVLKGMLPSNPNTEEYHSFAFWSEAKRQLAHTHFSISWFFNMLWDGVKDSRMILRWLLLGVLLASAIRAFVPLESFEAYFGATLLGLFLTMVMATIVEICSEGSTPIAADIVTRAQAPGNGFAFLMGGVSTDYTEIITLKETTGSWKVAVFLPLVTLPQITVLALILNQL
jgi:hypothetical protein